MEAADRHPNDRDIDAYARGLASWQDIRVIERHLHTCPECARKVTFRVRMHFEPPDDRGDTSSDN